jgi:hypothetical protein
MCSIRKNGTNAHVCSAAKDSALQRRLLRAVRSPQSAVRSPHLLLCNRGGTGVWLWARAEPRRLPCAVRQPQRIWIYIYHIISYIIATSTNNQQLSVATGTVIGATGPRESKGQGALETVQRHWSWSCCFVFCRCRPSPSHSAQRMQPEIGLQKRPG